MKLTHPFLTWLAAGRAAVEERTSRGMSVLGWKFSHPGFASFAYGIYICVCVYMSYPFFFFCLFLVS